jgi:uncharacterized protein (TIGR02996 family)
MDPTLAGLLRACQDEPFDDARRLVLADWLEEHGDADRAEYLRLSFAPERFWYGGEGTALAIRYEQLLRANAERWLGPARQWYFGASLSRGFVTIHASARQLLDHPPAELPADVLPWLENLYLRSDSEPAERDDVLSSSLLGLFSQLEFCGDFHDARHKLGEPEVRLLVANPALNGVRFLRLTWNRLDRACAELLARCEHLAELRHLDLNANPLGDEGAAALAEAPWLAGVTRLHLGETALSAAGFASIFRSPRLGLLTHLSLTNSRLDEAAAWVIAGAPQLASVTDLSLECVTATDPGVLRTLAASPHLRPAKLNLSTFRFGEAGAAALASGRLLERTRNLHLANNNLTEAASAQLLGSGQLAGVEFLSLYDPVGDAGCEVLASSGHFARLRTAYLQRANRVEGRCRLGAVTGAGRPAVAVARPQPARRLRPAGAVRG